MCPRCTHMHVRTPASTMCAHLPTCACTGHTRYAHTCMCAHTYPHTCSHTHILCAHMQELVCTLHLCTYKHPAHRRACPHVHTRAYTHTHALAHVCTPTHAHVPVASLTLPAAGRLCLWCPSTGSSSRRRAGFHLTASPLREPICPCLLWTWGSVTGPAPGWQLCPLYPECSPLPPKPEARDSSPGGLPALPGWRGAPFTGLLCAPQGRPSSDLISAMGSCGQATSLSLCLWGGLPHSLPWKRAEGMGGPKGLVTSILPSHTGCQCGHLCGWQLAEHSSASPRARPGLPNQQPLLVSILWRSWT